jgi:hypothetical protein
MVYYSFIWAWFWSHCMILLRKYKSIDYWHPCSWKNTWLISKVSSCRMSRPSDSNGFSVIVRRNYCCPRNCWRGFGHVSRWRKTAISPVSHAKNNHFTKMKKPVFNRVNCIFYLVSLFFRYRTNLATESSIFKDFFKTNQKGNVSSKHHENVCLQ